MTKMMNSKMNKTMTAACAGAAFCRAGRHYYGVHYYLRSGAGTAGTGRLCTYAIGTDNRMTR